MKKIDRTGEKGYNIYGLSMEIVSYKNNKNIMVRFASGEVRQTTYYRFRRGLVYPTWRNKPINEPKETEYDDDDEEFEDNYDKIRFIGIATAIALGVGVAVLGVGAISAIGYGIVKLCEYLI